MLHVESRSIAYEASGGHRPAPRTSALTASCYAAAIIKAAIAAINSTSISTRLQSNVGRELTVHLRIVSKG